MRGASSLGDWGHILFVQGLLLSDDAGNIHLIRRTLEQNVAEWKGKKKTKQKRPPSNSALFRPYRYVCLIENNGRLWEQTSARREKYPFRPSYEADTLEKNCSVSSEREVMTLVRYLPKMSPYGCWNDTTAKTLKHKSWNNDWNRRNRGLGFFIISLLSL